MSNQNPEHQQGNQALTDAENRIKEACEILKRETSRLRQEQESIDAMSTKLDQVHFSWTVKLNVGGQQFTTSVQTLRKDPNSMLAAMFSGRFEIKPSQDGSYFIDRDGTYFRFILNYLRNGELILPKGATFLEELEAEARFYQLQGIVDELKSKVTKLFEESVILTNEEHRRVLTGWLPAETAAGEWRLLFRASRDGFLASQFHSKCDNKGPTITVVKSGGYLFGGFTENAWTSPAAFQESCHIYGTANQSFGYRYDGTANQSFGYRYAMFPATGADNWRGNKGKHTIKKDPPRVEQSGIRGGQGGWVSCRQAFLFSLVNPSGLEPTKLSLMTGRDSFAIYCNSNRGPVFGGGNDLCISSNANTADSYSYLGNSYQCPPAQPSSSFFTGAANFTVTDYEVFGLRQ